MKKMLCLVLTCVLCLSMAVCLADEDNWKIAILTATTSQGEEEFRGAQHAVETYGADHVVTDTYPDNFMAEQETTISKMLAFASDPDVKALIMCQSVPGTKAGFDKIRELGRDDMLLIAAVPQEDPAVISAACDLALYTDDAKQGDTIAETVADWGCEVFVHYSFPRHLAVETVAARKNNLMANFEALGIEYVEATAPDPTSDAGVSGAQQFILEDVPAKMEQYAGKKVAFFTTNCAMQESLQTAVLAQPNAYYPQPCCPSPYHGFPASLGLEIAAGGDDTAALKAIASKLAESDAVGRFSTWPSPVNMTILDVACSYAKAYIDGETNGRCDADAIRKLCEQKAPGAVVNNYTNADGETLDNYFTILLKPVDFNDYL